ncbi:brct domain containing protein [Metarhizium album ARSEF 1941]|uniref:Brct domain containing protein n=1 Tax=Metarhizium album (strain ARSEF 1941) TaxID=1081103 RepID=A0A0B2WTL4_METAS|nr:brct domain containing protein [Metarhizium album ARSEF 1941]KHN97004.1 brct domain containing protein [Metarhizium album ARSEF 1941]
MPKPPAAPLPRPAVPRNTASDPWNSSSTGHQRADHHQRGTGWRDSRNRKLNSQFRSAPQGHDVEANEPRAGATVVDMLRTPRLMATTATTTTTTTITAKRDVPAGEDPPRGPGIFAGCVVYVNGSTYPLVSDHKLKRVLVENGAQTSLHLGRKKVTHVILGRPAGGLVKGAGGGLAGGKMEREIRRIGGAGVRFVGAEWVLESLKTGRRLPEARFSNVKVAAAAQGSVYGLCSGNGAAGGSLS